MVAEDHADSRRLIEALLRGAGFEVGVAETGRQAVEMFKQWQPHFVWMDMRMPVMDGYSATKAIRSLPSGRDVKIAALTARAVEAERESIMAAGCDALLAKPIERERLFLIMGELLNLQYRYTDDQPIANLNPRGEEPDLRGLGDASRAELQQAAEELDLNKCRETIERMRHAQPAEASALEALIEDFRFDLILAALSRSTED